MQEIVLTIVLTIRIPAQPTLAEFIASLDAYRCFMWWTAATAAASP